MPPAVGHHSRSGTSEECGIIHSFFHGVCIALTVELKYLLLPHANTEVRLIELIRDVPAQSPKLPPLLDQGVEEAQPKQQLLPCLRLKERGKCS